MPVVSVIIPVYNAEKYLRECLDSVINQTFKDIEIICVDDGSTDKSLEILKEYAERDNRFVILQQENLGAASARNFGMGIAKGEYLLFLDSDDIFSEVLLEKTVAKAEFYDADITIYKVVSFNTNNNAKAVMKENITGFKSWHHKTFSYKDIPDKIFNSFLIPAWNKLLKKSFVIENGIRFQDIKRHNDLYFTNKALVLATRIILLDEVLLYYRVGMNSNLQSRKDLTPLDVCKALMELKNFLNDEGLYLEVEKSFIKLSVDNIFFNLNEIKSAESREFLINFLRNEGFEHLGISKCSDLYKITFWGYLQFWLSDFSSNKTVLSGLYAIDKLWEYFKFTGFNNTVKKVLLKR